MKNKILDKIYSYKRSLYKDISDYNEIEFELNKSCNEIYLYTLNHINKFKKKKIYTKEDLYSLKKAIENLEVQCSKEIEKNYNTLIKKQILAILQTILSTQKSIFLKANI